MDITNLSISQLQAYVKDLEEALALQAQKIRDYEKQLSYEDVLKKELRELKNDYEALMNISNYEKNELRETIEKASININHYQTVANNAVTEVDRLRKKLDGLKVLENEDKMYLMQIIYNKNKQIEKLERKLQKSNESSVKLRANEQILKLKKQIEYLTKNNNYEYLKELNKRQGDKLRRIKEVINKDITIGLNG